MPRWQVRRLQAQLTADGSTGEGAELAPWDVEYLTHRHLAALMPPAAQALLSPHLTLQGLLQGLNDLLQRHWGGLSLQLQRAAAGDAARTGSSNGEGDSFVGGSDGGARFRGGAWGPGVLKLVLFAADGCERCRRWGVSHVADGGGAAGTHCGEASLTQRGTGDVLHGRTGASRGRGSDGPSSGAAAGRGDPTSGALPHAPNRRENAVVGPAMRPRGVLYVDPGAGGYGTRQLGFCRDAPSAERPSLRPAGVEQRYGVQDAQQMEEALWGLPVVSVGLQWAWREGRAGELRTLQQLSVCGAARPSHSNKFRRWCCGCLPR